MVKQSRRWIVWAMVMALGLPLIAGCAQPAAQTTGGDLTGTITVSGAFALYPMVVKWGEEFQKLHPGVQFDISAGGAGKGMADTLAGQVDLGMVSRAIRPEEEKQGAYGIAVTKDAVFPAINAQNPVLKELLSAGITRDQLIGIYITGEIETWGQLVNRPELKDEIHIFTRSDAAGAAETWALFLGNKKQEDLKGIGVYGDPGIMDAVVKDPLGIGYNNLNYAFDAATGKPINGSVVLAIDVNGNRAADNDEVIDTKPKALDAVATGRYPSPPARALYLVTKGKPTGLVQTFLQWVLSNGQQFVDSTGYVPLPKDQLDAGLDKLK